MKLSYIALVVAAFAVCVMADDGYSAPSYDKKEGYFQYANVPGEHEYEFGYNRGNPSHYTSRFEQSKDWRFRTKVKWGDSYDGYGEHYWEYNHGHHEPEYHAPAYEKPAYNAPAYDKPAYSPPAYEKPAYEKPAYEKPAYSPPAYEKPAYEKPAYEKPSYSAPVYKPTYSSSSKY